jgi:hypothetical protein
VLTFCPAEYLYDVAATRKEAHREGVVQVARAALLKGLDINIVRDITGLDADAIRHLQEN